jgi:hypothetical protein
MEDFLATLDKIESEHPDKAQVTCQACVTWEDGATWTMVFGGNSEKPRRSPAEAAEDYRLLICAESGRRPFLVSATEDRIEHYERLGIIRNYRILPQETAQWLEDWEQKNDGR